MKKTLAIVLALVMVLAMIPAMSADTTQTKEISNKSYYIAMTNVQTGAEAAQYKINDKQANTIEYKFNWDAQAADVTGKWTDESKMALVFVGGFDPEFTDKATVYVDGKKVELDDYPVYAEVAGFVNGGAQAVWFPVELTKAGYSDSYLVQVKDTVNGVEITETAKISVKLVNEDVYKDAETAVVTNIVSKTANVSAYIVGDKIYFDFIDGIAPVTSEITFADENGKAFSAITYAYNPELKQADGSYAKEPSTVSLNAYLNGRAEIKLDKSAAKFDFATAANGRTLKFDLETKAANYETKAYTVKMRANIKPEDPKGIYFAENTKTIAMGEKFAPVVVGVKTGKPVAAKITLNDEKTDAEVIDILDGTTVIGTREGVAYVIASYTVPGNGGKSYVASAMKVVVTLPGESIPAVDPAAEIYYVTCRNLNVRAGGSTSYKKVDMIHRGDAVKVLEIKNGWAKLADGTYVCAKYIAK